ALFLHVPAPPPISLLFPYTPLFRSRFRSFCPLPEFRQRTAGPVDGILARRRHLRNDLQGAWTVFDGRAHVEDRPRALKIVPKVRSEEHTSELQSLTNLVCPLLLENN